MLRLAVFLSVATWPAFANERLLSPSEFEDLVTGHTYSYSSSAEPFGIEEYSDNRRVRWSFLDGACVYGRWYEADEQICFVYEGIETPQCWTFFLDDTQLLARFENDPVDRQVYEAKRLRSGLQCMPEAGA